MARDTRLGRRLVICVAWLAFTVTAPLIGADPSALQPQKPGENDAPSVQQHLRTTPEQPHCQAHHYLQSLVKRSESSSCPKLCARRNSGEALGDRVLGALKWASGRQREHVPRQDAHKDSEQCSPPGLRNLTSLLNGPPDAGLSVAQAERAVVATGRGGRVDAFVRKLLRGEAVEVAFVGGSITSATPNSIMPALHVTAAMDLAAHHPDRYGGWPSLLFEWLNTTFPNPGHRLSNAAIPATHSSYMEACLRWHLPSQPDIVFVEYAVNDFSSDHVPAFERLLRKLLHASSDPAVFLVNMFSYACTFYSNCKYHETGIDPTYNVLAQYYQMPAVSWKAATWPEVMGNLSGFWLPAHQTDSNISPEDERYFSGPDRAHPNQRGMRMVAQMVAHVISRRAQELLLVEDLDAPSAPQPEPSPATTGPGAPAPPPEPSPAAAGQDIPAPMLEGNFAGRTYGCYFGRSVEELVVGNASGWSIVDDADPGDPPKQGLASLDPGAEVTLRVNTLIQDSQPDQAGGDGTNVDPHQKGTLVLLFGMLSSYETVGIASFACSGCSCRCLSKECHNDFSDNDRPIKFDFQWDIHASLTRVVSFVVSQHRECTIRVTNLKPPEGSPHGTKVKINSIMLSRAVDLANMDYLGSPEYQLSQLWEQRHQRNEESHAGRK